VIDPGDDIDKIKEEIKKYNLLAILITHHHFDHVGALDDLIKYKNVPIYDYNLTDTEYNIDKFNFKIIKTPGHTSDSITFYFENENIMFTGDFLFKGTIGRTDLPTGDSIEMEKSINKIKQYNKDIKIYPGHGDITTLEDEIKYNYFFV
jgi:glyoxylase-like metal-dependent hydrolase (beta-lactamase superfamily II)